MISDFDVVVFSHLRWRWVYQRPQHLLTRLAKHHRVWYIEEPVGVETDHQSLEIEKVAPDVTVVRPHLKAQYPFYVGEQIPRLTEMTTQFIAEHRVQPLALWFYTPMAMPVARALAPLAVAYDCMDELSAFRYAPPELLEREAQLLAWADVVFTGGPSLHRAKLGRHSNLHCFPSSIDTAHFRLAREADLREPPDQASLPRPRLGYFGVVDERLDYDLLGRMARARPDWQIVMVGPFTKVNPDELPHPPNLHYLGQRPYELLPAYISGWDVALMPFALNEATRFISPTKTLEYMAAGRPIVSTPIADVREPYGEIVYIAEGAEAFVAACERALTEPPAERLRRQQSADAVLAQTSWDDTADRMHALLDQAVQTRALQYLQVGTR
ncbi:MAG: glycosyltransferase [Anaerolineae bacterium]|nr:glycosyltransferase [Anaerolineae bacterium]